MVVRVFKLVIFVLLDVFFPPGAPPWPPSGRESLQRPILPSLAAHTPQYWRNSQLYFSFER